MPPSKLLKKHPYPDILQGMVWLRMFCKQLSVLTLPVSQGRWTQARSDQKAT